MNMRQKRYTPHLMWFNGKGYLFDMERMSDKEEQEYMDEYEAEKVKISSYMF